MSIVSEPNGKKLGMKAEDPKKRNDGRTDEKNGLTLHDAWYWLTYLFVRPSFSRSFKEKNEK